MKTTTRKALIELKKVKMVAREKYAFPGGYDLFIITRDGELLCAECCKNEFKQIAYDSFNNCDTGWKFEAVENASNLESEEYINENIEDYSLDYCAHCNRVLNP